MEKSCPPFLASCASTTTATLAIATNSSSSSSSSSNSNSSSSSSNNTDRNPGGSSSSSSVAIHNALRQLNKSSFKISKPVSKQSDASGGDPANPRHLPLPPPSAPPAAAPPPPPPQPPVYNISKNDFRDLVQKLTGSPAHHPRVSPPPVAGGATPSRLHKIRPPPLAQLTPRPPAAGGGSEWARPAPLSPLPPFPSVSASAESPITAYMRCLRSGSVPPQQALIPSPRGGVSGAAAAPSSPLGFSCVPSPRSAHQMMLPPGLLFPPSPTPSPK